MDLKDLKKIAGMDFEKGLSKHIVSGQMGLLFEWDRFIATIPQINFPKAWGVQIIPPFAGAVIRFFAFYKGKRISVYLDGFNALGAWSTDADGKPEPYWEAYPIKGDTFRCEMEDVTELIDEMKKEFKRK